MGSRWVGGLLLATGIAAGTVFAASESAWREPMRLFMRQKLAYSQGVLEGLALERYDLVAKNALLMRKMSQTNSWMVLKHPDYMAQTTNYQKSLDALYLAATSKELDKATEAYSKVARDCVECHRVVRLDQHVKAVQQSSQTK